MMLIPGYCLLASEIASVVFVCVSNLLVRFVVKLGLNRRAVDKEMQTSRIEHHNQLAGRQGSDSKQFSNRS